MSAPVIPNLLEQQWVSFKAMAMSPDAGEHQLRDMRWAFYGGAHALLCAIMGILDPDEHPTERDMAQMEAIQAELDAFIEGVRQEASLDTMTAAGRA